MNTLYYPCEIGGAERSVRVLAEGLARKGHAVTVICAGESDRTYQVGGVDVVQRAVRNLYWPFDGKAHATPIRLAWHTVDAYNILQAGGLSAVIRDRRIDVVHTNNLLGLSVSAWTAAARAQVPVVHTTRDFYLLCQRSTMRKSTGTCKGQCGSCRAFTAARRKLSKSVNAVVGISNSVLATHLHAGYFVDSERMVIHNAVTNEEPRSVEEVQSAAQRPATGGGQLVVGYLGRLEEAKGVEVLILAWLLKPVPNCTLKIAGSGLVEYEDRLKRMAGNSGIEFLGTVEAKSFMQGIDLLVVPSLWEEPMGRVVVEAYLSGKPVLASNRGGLPELVEEGRTGWIVEPMVETISAALSRVLGAPEKLQAMASDIVCKSIQFSADYMVEKYLTVYRQICRR